MEDYKRFQHAQYLIGFMNNYSLLRPDSQEVTISCREHVQVRTYALTLACVSEFLRKILSEIVASQEEDFCIVIPDLDPNHLNIFLRYLFSRDVISLFSSHDVDALENVFRTFDINFDHFRPFLNDPSASVHSSDVEDEEIADDNRSDDDNLESDFKGRGGARSRKRPNIISHTKSGRKSKSAKVVDNGSSDLDETSEVDDNVDKTRFYDMDDDNAAADMSSLKCRFCAKKYQHLKARNKHLISDHFEECEKSGLVHPCRTCGACFVTSRGLEKHKGRLHGKRRETGAAFKGIPETDGSRAADIVAKLICPFGHDDVTGFANIKELKAHVKDAHPERDKSCWACGLDFGARDELEQHIQVHQTHSREGRSFYNCEYCHTKFLSEYNLVSHKRDVHSSASTLNCRICDKEFK